LLSSKLKVVLLNTFCSSRIATSWRDVSVPWKIRLP